MCGITGFWSFGARAGDSHDTLKRMTQAIRHRGPDDEGQWCDDGVGIALGHRRLSILDLSAHGHQPMFSASGRYVIVFNGEIYNFQDLRDQLNGGHLELRGHSDTEVMLAAIERLGLLEAVRRFNGMFAFSLFDREERKLHLVRDRLGEKPLYYGWSGNTLLFGSELKALRQHPDWQGEIDRGALTLFLRHSYVPAPHSIYRGIHKVLPGAIVTFRMTGPRSSPDHNTYWSPQEAAESGVATPATGTQDELLGELDALLRKTVGREMVADVPLGAFLSGGIDSSLIVALMQAQSSQPVRTFTIGFHEEGYNEATFAKEVAQHLGTDHTELYVTPEEAQAVIPKLPVIYDEPLSDSSQIPTYLVSGLARSRVTVSLSGDGGDELFGGYHRYFRAQRKWNMLEPVPGVVRRAVGRGIRLVHPPWWNGNGRRFTPSRFLGAVNDHRLHQLAEVLTAETEEGFYRTHVTHWPLPATIVKGGSEPLMAYTDQDRWADLPELFRRMMYLDMVSYLPDDILVKVDRASMAHSLESRAPLLDHQVVEFAWRVPLEMKVQDNKGKWLLRRLLSRYVPERLFERPKMGFGVPIDSWLRGPLRDWAEALLDPRALADGGFFAPGGIRKKWHDHLKGERDWQYLLWDVLMFQAWLEAQ